MARNIPNAIGRDRSQLVGNPGGLAALAQSDYQKLSQLPGFQNISPVASQNGSYVFNPRDIRDLIRSQRGSPVQASGPALSGPAAQPPGGPAVPMVQPAVNPGNAPGGWNAAYDPTLGRAKSKSAMGGIGYDTTGYLAASRGLEGELNKRFGTSRSTSYDNDGVMVGGTEQLGSPVKYNAYTGQLEYAPESGQRVSWLSGYNGRADLEKMKKANPKRYERLQAENAAELAKYTGQVSANPQLQAQIDAANALRGQYQQKYMPEALTKQIQGMMGAGLDFAKTGMVGSNEEALFRLSAALSEKGITDLRQIGVAQDAKGKPVYYNKATGQDIGRGVINFKGGSGDGNLDVFLKHDPKSGQVYFTTDFESPEKTGLDYMDQLVPAVILGMAAGPAGAALGAGMGGGAAATMAGNALAYGTAGGAQSAMQGGDFGTGFLTGAIGGAAGSLGTGAGQVDAGQSLLGVNAPAWQTAAINRGLQGALSGGLQGAMRGGNALESALTGGLGGAVSGGLQSYGAGLAGNNPLARGLVGVGTSALSGGLKSTLQGRDFGEGLKSGAVSGATNIGRGFLTRFGRGQV